MTCSGIHRQFNRKVKSITASEFHEDEVVGIENGGNDFAANYWLATYIPSDFPEPSSGEASKIKDFMVQKYDQKRWVYVEKKAKEKKQISESTPAAKSDSKPKKTTVKKEKEMVRRKTAEEELEEQVSKEEKAREGLSKLASIVSFEEDEDVPVKNPKIGSKKVEEKKMAKPVEEEKKKTKSVSQKENNFVEDLFDFNSFENAEPVKKQSANISHDGAEEPWGFEAISVLEKNVSSSAPVPATRNSNPKAENTWNAFAQPQTHPNVKSDHQPPLSIPPVFPGVGFAQDPSPMKAYYPMYAYPPQVPLQLPVQQPQTQPPNPPQAPLRKSDPFSLFVASDLPSSALPPTNENPAPAAIPPPLFYGNPAPGGYGFMPPPPPPGYMPYGYYAPPPPNFHQQAPQSGNPSQFAYYPPPQFYAPPNSNNKQQENPQ